MKRYYSPAACSLAVHIGAREAGLPVDMVKVDLTTHRLAVGTDYYRVNPHGYPPALRLDDDTLLTVVVAIVQYLGDLKHESGFVPAGRHHARVRQQEWLTFVNSEHHNVFSP